MSGDIFKTPYAPFLEETIRAMLDLQPEKIGFCAITPDGTVLTSYYGKSELCPQDKAVMAYHIHSDAVMDIVMANAKYIVQEADREGDDDDGS